MHSVCIVIYVSMYLHSYLSTHGISGLAARCDCQQIEVPQKMMTKMYSPWLRAPPVPMSLSTLSATYWQCTWRPWSSVFGVAIGYRDWVNLEMHWEAVIEQVWRSTLRPWLSEFGDGMGDQDSVNSEMHWEAEIERDWTYTWRPR